jgi:hypothetical protein
MVRAAPALMSCVVWAFNAETIVKMINKQYHVFFMKVVVGVIRRRYNPDRISYDKDAEINNL